MSTRNDGGPAFPVLELDQRTENVCAQHMGVTLRDYFACEAMHALMRQLPLQKPASAGLVTRREIAQEAYWMADAMLKARDA